MDLFSQPKSLSDGVAKGGAAGMLVSNIFFPRVREKPTNAYDMKKATENNLWALALTAGCASAGALWGADNQARREGGPRPYAQAAMFLCILIAAAALYATAEPEFSGPIHN